MSFLPNRKYARTILKIASPAIAGYSSQMVVSIIDTAMVGRLEGAEIILAAMGLGVLATWTLTTFFSSLSTGTHILVARRYGEGDDGGAGAILKHSLVLTFFLGTLFGILGYLFAEPFIDVFSADNRVSHFAGQYIQFRALGLPFFLMGVSFRAFFYGIGHTKVFMYSALLSYVVNILFNYFLIFGTFGFPKMGVAGAGLASSIGMVVGLLYFAVAILRNEYRIRYQILRGLQLTKETLLPIIKLSAPVSFQNILILFGFLLFVSITGRIGTTEQAATQVVITALFVSFMPCFGFGVAAQTLVGNALGNNKPKIAYIYGIETAKIAVVFTLIVGALFAGLPEYCLRVLTNNDNVIRLATPILRLVGGAQIIYGAGIVLSAALQGAGDTLYVMNLEIITHWILFLPVSFVLAVYAGLGLLGAWLAMPMYVTAYTTLSYLKFRSGSWKAIRV